MSLSQRALVVTLQISQWSARKYDKKISDEVEQSHNAADAGRYNKKLIKKDYLQDLNKVVGKARDFHYDNTLPWSDLGERILSTDNFMTYSNEMIKFKSEYEALTNQFISQYPDMVADAKLRLNGMFNANDYPSISEIQYKFNFRTAFMPIPEADFRVDLGADEIEMLKANVENEITLRLQDAVKDIWKRIKEQLLIMRDKFSDGEAIFRDTLFGNLKEIIDLLPKLNITRDENIVAVCDDLKRIMVDNPDSVRSSGTLRKKKEKEVKEVLNKFESFFGPAK